MNHCTEAEPVSINKICFGAKIIKKNMSQIVTSVVTLSGAKLSSANFASSFEIHFISHLNKVIYKWIIFISYFPPETRF